MVKKIFSVILCIAMLGTTFIGCSNDSESVREDSQDSASDTQTTGEEETKLTLKDIMGLDIKLADLNELMQPVFMGDTCKNETVMFLDKGEIKSLLFPIENIISVTSYDEKKVYKEGTDYKVVDGKLKVLKNSNIPCITSKVYYNYAGSKLTTIYNGKEVPTYWGETAMTKYQIKVTYTHSTSWEGFWQESGLEIYQNFIKKLQDGKDVTVFFCGDSITYGANASWIMNEAPYQYSYPILFTQALADLFDYTIHYEAANLNGTSPVPEKDYVAGTRGTITYVNVAVGGWDSSMGVSTKTDYVVKKIKAHGCDLFVIGYGMNDKTIEPKTTKANVEVLIDAVLRMSPDSNIVLLATMVPNPDGVNWYGNQDKQEEQLKTLAEEYRGRGVACGVCCMTSTSLDVLKYKDFHDYSGNNINHPNDYFVRIYAQTLLQLVVGYENMS